MEVSKIYVYSEFESNRLHYVCDLIFNTILGVKVEIITQLEKVYDKEFLIN